MKEFIWLFGENRGRTADNNSFYFWKYAVKIQDNIKKYFVMEASAENKRIYDGLSDEEKENIIWKNSKRHFFVFFHADMFFITLGRRDISPDRLAIARIDLFPHRPVIRLGHGNLAIKKVGYTGKAYGNNMFRCVYYNPTIKDTLIEENDFAPYQLYYSEYLPRYQELCSRELNKKAHTKTRVLWFITWREYFGRNAQTEDFLKTVNQLLANEDMRSILERQDIEFTVCVHQFFGSEYGEEIKKLSQKYGIRFLLATEIDLLDEIVENDVLITDYSSLGFDFTALNKPVIMFQPDLEEYLKQRELYCSKEELCNYNVEKVEDLIELIKNQDFKTNSFFLKRSKVITDLHAVATGKHIEKMYLDFKRAQENRITFIGYNFFGEGGTVFATRALAEALMEEGYMVELRSLKREGNAVGCPGGVNLTYEYSENRKNLVYKIFLRVLKSLGCYKYLRHDKNKRKVLGVAERRMKKYLEGCNSLCVISTRESFHPMLYDVDEVEYQKLYFFHCPVEVFETNFPELIAELNRRKLEKAIFVTEKNREQYEKRFAINNFGQECVLGNTLENKRYISEDKIEVVPSKTVYRGVYLVRLDESRQEDLESLILFGQYLRDNDIKDIEIDVYGDGNYKRKFLEIIREKELQLYIKYCGVTRDVRTTISQYDAVTDFSVNHSFGMPYVEAILNGKMVYCRDTLGAREVLQDIPDAFFYTPEELVQKMRGVSNLTLSELKDNYNIIDEKYGHASIVNRFLCYMKE